MQTVAREAWTDNRLDDLSQRMGESFQEVKAEIKSTRTELKAEIASLRTELKGEIDATRAELKAEITSTRTELKTEINFFRKELKEEIASTREDSNAAFVQLNDRFDRLNYTMIAALIGLVATHYLG